MCRLKVEETLTHTRLYMRKAYVVTPGRISPILPGVSIYILHTIDCPL
jgi:hypothetical protein